MSKRQPEQSVMQMQSKEPVNHFTVKGVADYCLVSKVTVRRWIKSGRLPAIRLPSGHYRISVVDFRGFLGRYDIPIREELFESKS